MAKAKSKANGGAPDFRPIIQDVALHFEKELGGCIAELNEAVQFGGGEASFTTTLQIKRGKKGRFTAKLSARVRAPREPVTIDMHIENGQLVMGFDEVKHGIPDEAEEGAGAEA